MAEKREDFRITKTKNALIEAFTALILEKKFENITVNELCDRAEVRRATFYKHFTDKFDFLMFVIKMHREKFDKNIWMREKPDVTMDYYIQYVDAFLSNLERESNLIDSILKSNISHTIIQMLVEQNFLDTKDKIDESLAEGLEISMSSETAAALITGGLALAITRWLTSENRIPKDELVKDVAKAINAVLAPVKGE